MGVFLLHGSDEILVSEHASDLVRQLVGDEDRALVLEEFGGDYPMAAATEAARTPPFFTERRVIVVRRDGGFVADDVDVLVTYIDGVVEASRVDGFVDFTDFVIEWGSSRVSEPLKKAVKNAGGQVIDPSPPTRTKERRAWWERQVEAHGLQFDAAGMNLLIDWLGEDVSRFEGLAETLLATYGNIKITADLLRPFLGTRGDALPWDLTDSIDKGNAAEALRAARRMMHAGERHPLQILAQLHNHYTRLAKLDTRDSMSLADAESVLGIKGFPAEKAFNTYRSLGHEGIRRAFQLLASADSDLRGGTGLDDAVVMDVLVARLARLAPAISRRR